MNWNFRLFWHLVCFRRYFRPRCFNDLRDGQHFMASIFGKCIEGIIVKEDEDDSRFYLCHNIPLNVEDPITRDGKCYKHRWSLSPSRHSKSTYKNFSNSLWECFIKKIRVCNVSVASESVNKPVPKVLSPVKLIGREKLIVLNLKYN